MNDKLIIDLEIIDELEDSGVDAIALVDSPAIEKNFLYFRKEGFVEPASGESESDYMGRCVKTLIDEGKPQDQAIAICISTYESKMSRYSFAKVSFDYDDTLSTEAGFELAKKYVEEGDELYIISARNEVSQTMIDKAKELGIPQSRIYATGSNKSKVEKVKELNISKHIDNNADVVNELGIIGEKFEISTATLPKYVSEVKKDEVNLSAVLEFAKTAGFSSEDFLTNGMEFNEIPNEFNLELARGYTVYKYVGNVSSSTRDFCREMVDLDRFYTFDEIQEMGNIAVNPGFGLAGASTYSIWEYKGGPNCKHRWQKFYVTPEGTFQNKGPAPGTPGERPINMPNNGYAFKTDSSYMFADESKKELVGPVAIPDIEIPRLNKETNQVYYVRFSKDVVKRMAEKFMREKRVAESNIQHKKEYDAGSYVYETWIVENLQDKANSVYGLNVPIGTWMCKMRVVDENTWKKVKAGQLNGFSLEGDFVSAEEYEAYLKDKKMYEDLVNLVKSL